MEVWFIRTAFYIKKLDPIKVDCIDWLHISEYMDGVCGKELSSEKKPRAYSQVCFANGKWDIWHLDTSLKKDLVLKVQGVNYHNVM